MFLWGPEMKSIVPLFCFVGLSAAGASAVCSGLDAYRNGDYVQAAKQLMADNKLDPVASYYLGRMQLYGYGILKDNQRALNSFRMSAEKGFLPAQNFMARYSLLVDKDPQAAFVWFNKASQANDVDAQVYCAAAYLFGLGVAQNEDKAKVYSIAAARNGNASAQLSLAESFLATRQIANKKLGVLWLQKAVAQKHPGAQVTLGQLYLSGTVVDHDLIRAKEYVNLAMAQGYLPAWYAMGQIAESEQNISAAIAWYMHAANLKDPQAAMALSRLYFDAKSPIHDDHLGFLWMLNAAQNDSKVAEKALADLYKNGLGVPKSDLLAGVWSKKSNQSTKLSFEQLTSRIVRWVTWDKGSTWAQTNYRLTGISTAWNNTANLSEQHMNAAPHMDMLAREALYTPQFVMTQPNEISIGTYYNALVTSFGQLSTNVLVFPADQLSSDWAATFASHCALPDTTSQQTRNLHQLLSANSPAVQALFRQHHPVLSTAEVLKRLEHQAILGDSNAQFDLGQAYEYGLGMEKNLAQALYYYRMAAAQQALNAQYHVGALLLQGFGEPGETSQGYAILLDTAFKGLPQAQYAVARLNESGFSTADKTNVVKVDNDQAMSMYTLAAVNNYGPAEYRLAEIMVRDKASDLTVAGSLQREKLIAELYRGAVAHGITAAIVPLAFYDAMSSDVGLQKHAFLTAKKAATAGDSHAALLLGLMYDRGLTVPADAKYALNWYENAAKNPVSSFILGTYSCQAKDVEQGKAGLAMAAKANFPYAYLNLAILHRAQHQEFLPELQTALELGNNKAGLLLADYAISQNTQGPGVNRAREIYHQFAQQGDALSALKFGYVLEQGLGGAVDLNGAKKWYEIASLQGNAQAQYLLGSWYQQGIGQTLGDDAAATKWYASAQAHYAPAAVALGFMEETINDRYDLARQAYEQAANTGNAMAQYNLGLMYAQGKGCPVDFAAAKLWFAKAADQKLHYAMVQLASLYANGTGVARDQAQALAWYQKAAALGNEEASLHLRQYAAIGAK